MRPHGVRIHVTRLKMGFDTAGCGVGGKVSNKSGTHKQCNSAKIEQRAGVSA